MSNRPTTEELQAELDAALEDFQREQAGPDFTLDHYLRAARRFRVLKAQVDRESAPALPERVASPAERVKHLRDLALWLREHVPFTQQEIADYLNDHAQTTLRGRPWSQAGVSYLIRPEGRWAA